MALNYPAYATVAVTAVAGLCATLPLAAGEMKMELDCTANARLLDTHFGRYGSAAAKTIARDAKGTVGFRLPAAKDLGQHGLYSYIVLAGDFEVSATYEWIDVTPPQIGYGAGCGIAVDTGGGGVMVSLARTHFADKDKGPGYGVTVGRSAGTEVDYKTQYFYSKATRGRLVLRREKGELICLTADGPKGELEERCRVDYPDGTVRQVRFFADTGGSPTALDARLGQIRVRADEVTGGFPRSEQPRAIPWWLIVAVSLLIVAIALFFVRRRLQGHWGWSSRDG
jgi:hypothetical protein